MSDVAIGPRGRARSEWACLARLVALLVVAVLLPPIEQPARYHAFADTRAWAGFANAANVLSNLVFVAAAVLIAAGSARPSVRSLSTATRASLVVAAAGLLLTACGSAYYHSRPDDATLVWDRLPITVTVSGIVAIVLAQRVSDRAAWIGLIVLLVLGLASVLYWRATGNVTPYGVLQMGVTIALMLIALATPRGNDPFPWWWVILGYALAKVAETFDTTVFEVLGRSLSGHTLKHLLAGLAAAGLAWPFLRAR